MGCFFGLFCRCQCSRPQAGRLAKMSKFFWAGRKASGNDGNDRWDIPMTAGERMRRCNICGWKTLDGVFFNSEILFFEISP